MPFSQLVTQDVSERSRLQWGSTCSRISVNDGCNVNITIVGLPSYVVEQRGQDFFRKAYYYKGFSAYAAVSSVRLLHRTLHRRGGGSHLCEHCAVVVSSRWPGCPPNNNIVSCVLSASRFFLKVLLWFVWVGLHFVLCVLVLSLFLGG